MSHKVQRVKVTHPPGSAIFSFFDPAAVDSALRSNNFTVHDEIAMLIETMRNAATPWERFAAMRFLNNLMKDSLVLSGQVRLLTGEIEESSGNVKLEARALQLLETASKHSEIVTENHDSDQEIIDVEIEDVQEESDQTDPAEGSDGGGGDTPQVEIDEEGEEHSALGELREGHFPPKANEGGLATTTGGPGSTEDDLEAEVR